MRHHSPAHLIALLLVAAGFLAVLPAPAAAQFGIGPRMSFVRGDATNPNANLDRFIGAALRARLAERTAVELSLDYRTYVNQLTSEKTRDLPVQASVLMYPLRSTLSIYLLGGIGWYSQSTKPLTVSTSDSTVSTSRTGYHTGLGGELMLGRHAAAYLDYRYIFIHFNADTPGAAGAVPIPGTTSLQDKLKLSHEGSMWTTGVTVYF
jgi:hypothetical protein